MSGPYFTFFPFEKKGAVNFMKSTGFGISPLFVVVVVVVVVDNQERDYIALW